MLNQVVSNTLTRPVSTNRPKRSNDPQPKRFPWELRDDMFHEAA